MNLIKKHLKKRYANDIKSIVKTKLLALNENEAFEKLCDCCDVGLFKGKDDYMKEADFNITDWFDEALSEKERSRFNNNLEEYKAYIRKELHGKYFAYDAFECPAYADRMVPALPLMYNTLEDLIDDLLANDKEFGFFYKYLLDDNELS